MASALGGRASRSWIRRQSQWARRRGSASPSGPGGGGGGGVGMTRPSRTAESIPVADRRHPVPASHTAAPPSRVSSTWAWRTRPAASPSPSPDSAAPASPSSSPLTTVPVATSHPSPPARARKTWHPHVPQKYRVAAAAGTAGEDGAYATSPARRAGARMGRYDVKSSPVVRRQVVQWQRTRPSGGEGRVATVWSAVPQRQAIAS